MMKQKLFAAVCAFALCAALGTAIHAGQEAETAAPVAENLELTTFRNTSVGGTLSASAPDGSPLTFRITTEPTTARSFTPRPTASAGATTSAFALPTAAAESRRRRP